MNNLFDRIMDNEDLTDEEVAYVEKLKSEELSEGEQEVYKLFEEQDDYIYNFNPKYFKNIREKDKVLAKITYLQDQEAEEG